MSSLVLAALVAGGLLLGACGTEGASGGGGVATDVEATEAPTDDAAGAPSGDVAGGGVEAACALAVEVNGQLYLGAAAEPSAEPGASLGEGVYPPCNDTPGADISEAAAEPVEVFAITGVDPSDAVLVEGQDNTVFIREGADLEAVLEQIGT